MLGRRSKLVYKKSWPVLPTAKGIADSRTCAKTVRHNRIKMKETVIHIRLDSDTDIDVVVHDMIKFVCKKSNRQYRISEITAARLS